MDTILNLLGGRWSNGCSVRMKEKDVALLLLQYVSAGDAGKAVCYGTVWLSSMFNSELYVGFCYIYSGHMGWQFPIRFRSYASLAGVAF